MKFAEHLLAHITPEWRRQYIVYEDMKTMLYEAIGNMPTLETADRPEIERLVKAFDEDFLAFCEKELFKINVFYEEKLAEAKRKFDTLRKEMDAIALEVQQNQLNQQHHHHHHNHHNHHHSHNNHRDHHPRHQGHPAQHPLNARNSIGRLVGFSTMPDVNYRSTLNLRQRQMMSSSSSAASVMTQSQLAAASATGNKSLAEAKKLNSADKPPLQPPTTISSLINNSGASANNSSSNIVINNSTRQLSRRDSSVKSNVIMAGGGRKSSCGSQNSQLLINETNQLTSGSNVHHGGYTNYGTLSTTVGVDKKKLQDLRLAFSEFYLSLVLLQNYQRLNYTGFRKIFKKHDKLISNEEGKRWHHAHVESAFFHTNKDVDKLIEDTENIFTYQLEAGDRQKAMKRLRVPPLNDAPQPWTAFRVGFSLGAFVVLIVAVILTGIFQQTGDDWRIVFRLYRSSLFIIFFIFLVGINIYGWRAHGVNHVLIFELDPRDHLGGQDLLEIAFSFGLLWCISVLLFLWSGPIGIPPLLNPMILNGIMLIYLFNPTKTFHYSARTWLICCIGRVITAPFHRVRFSDFWLADQLNSMVPVLLDMEYTSCFYFTSSDLYGNVAPDRCVVREPRDLILRSFVACLPAWWRFAQCVRRYFDEGRRANPHLLNAGKYSTVWMVVIFSTLTEHNQDFYSSSLENPFFICWVISLVIGSCYTYTWDIKMDWGLFDPKAPAEYRFLREELVYPVKYYYVAIVEDFILRFGWTLNLSLTEVGAIPPDLITLVLAPCEIVRRFLWNFYRLENEHLNNCGEFRAVRDISISGQNIDLSALNRILQIMDEPDGLTSFRSKVKSQLLAAKKKAINNEGSDPSVVLVI